MKQKLVILMCNLAVNISVPFTNRWIVHTK